MWRIKVFLPDFSGDLTIIFRLAYGVHEKTVSNGYHRYHPKNTLYLFALLYHKRGIITRGLAKIYAPASVDFLLEL
jgi:hypothetical protein